MTTTTITAPIDARSLSRKLMTSVNPTALVVAALGGVALTVLAGILTANPLFVFVGPCLCLATLLGVLAVFPTHPATKPIAGSRETSAYILAVVSLVSACVAGLALVAIVFGHVARNQIRSGGGPGEKLALAALIVGYSEVFISVLTVAWFICAVR